MKNFEISFYGYEAGIWTVNVKANNENEAIEKALASSNAMAKSTKADLKSIKVI